MLHKRALILMLKHKFIIITFSLLAWTQATAAPEEITPAPEEMSKFARDIKREIQWTNHRITKAIEKSTDSILKNLKPNKDSLGAGEITAQSKELKKIVAYNRKFGSYLDTLIARQEMLYILLISVIALIFVIFIILLIYLKNLRKKLLPSEPTFKEELITTMDKIEKNLRVIPDTLKPQHPSIVAPIVSSQAPQGKDAEPVYESHSKNFQLIHSEVFKLRKSGHTQEEIARKLEIGKGEVEFILNLHEKGYKGKEENPEKDSKVDEYS